MIRAALIWMTSVCVACATCALTPVQGQEAKSGFDNTAIDSASSDPTDPTNKQHSGDKGVFDEVEQSAPNGLGPIYNAQSCRECHQNPISGGASQVTEHRAGHRDAHGVFQNPVVFIHGDKITGRTLINDRAICAEAQERVPEIDRIETNRLSISVLGDGFIEAIDDQTLLDLRKDECSGSNKIKGICGFAIYVPVLEAADKSRRIGRFGWKDQHASLMSFASDAYLNEMGITNSLLPDEFTNVCSPPVNNGLNKKDSEITEPNDIKDASSGETDLDHFARFMRETATPPRDTSATTPEALRGEKLFASLGCGVCHTSTLKTAAAGTSLNGGTYKVTEALGGKVIHPYSDFLLHDVGTGDGMVIAAPEHYGAALTAYLNELDDKKLTIEQATQLSLTKGAPRSRQAILAKEVMEEIPLEIEGALSKPVFERDVCDSASESDKVVEDKSQIFSLGRQCSANKIRTAPLWGVRIRTRLMHDGASLRFEDAIERHKGEAQPVTNRFLNLSKSDKDDLILFLKSL